MNGDAQAAISRPSAAMDAALLRELLEQPDRLRYRTLDLMIGGVARAVIVLMLFIFLFVVREALPVIFGGMSNAKSGRAVTPEAAVGMPLPALAAYLGQPETKLAALDTSAIRMLAELKAEELVATGGAGANPDLTINTLGWNKLLLPFGWHGHSEADFIWQPKSEVPKFNIVPLLFGSLKITGAALLLAVPLAVAAALYVSQLAPAVLRETVKPAIEILAGFPTVVLGFFGLMVVATIFQDAFGCAYRLNAAVAGFMVCLAIVPVIFTISEDALSAVPSSHRECAMAMGATKWHAAAHLVLPAALPGIAGAVMLGFGRAIGETMIALLVSGMAAVTGWSLFDSARPIAATIGAELADSVVGGDHYRILFLIGTILFAICFATNCAGDLIIHRLKETIHGRTSPEWLGGSGPRSRGEGGLP